MRILVLSPLFPPDTSDSAKYVKLLALRLTEANVDVTILLYGFLPESTPADTIAIDKRKNPLFRIFHFTLTLFRVGNKYDRIVINNGPSVELPLFLYLLLFRKEVVLCLSDTETRHTGERGWYSLLHKLLRKKVEKTIEMPDNNTHLPITVHPFKEVSDYIKKAHDTWWDNHVNDVIEL